MSDFTWDNTGRLKEIQHRTGSNPSSGTLLAGYGYDWNQRHELTALDFLPDGTNSPFNYSSEDVTEYIYDPRSQLTGANYPNTPNDETYIYDDNGNRLTVTNTGGANQDYDTASDNRLASDGTYTYQYDNEGNRTRRFLDGNQNGLYDAGDTNITEYAWDHRNRLVSATSYATHGGSATKQVYHTYDAQNQWIGRLVVEGTSILRTAFVWEAGQIVLEFNETGFGALGGVEVDDLKHRYLWGPAVDQLLADEKVNHLTNAALNERLWALQDHLWTVRDVIDDDGTVRKHTVFDSYGRITGYTYRDVDGDLISSSHAEAITQLFGYTGKPLDKTTGLQNNHHRWYDSQTGRWLSQDPIGFEAGDANLTRYVENAAPLLFDSDGLKGHHIVPIQLWDFFGFADEAKAIFDADNARIIQGQGLGHNRKAHGSVTGYTAHVKLELHNKLKEFMNRCKVNDGKLSIEQQKQFATEFVDYIKNKTPNKYIRGFNKAAESGVAGVTSWWDRYGRKLPHPNLPTKVLKIKGIAKLMPPADLTKTKMFKRIPGGKYVLAGPIAVLIYNNARADGLTVAQAGALAFGECVNPLPIGPSDLYEVGKWYGANFDAALRAGRGELTNPEGGVGRAQKLRRDLFEDLGIEYDRRTR